MILPWDLEPVLKRLLFSRGLEFLWMLEYQIFDHLELGCTAKYHLEKTFSPYLTLKIIRSLSLRLWEISSSKRMGKHFQQRHITFSDFFMKKEFLLEFTRKMWMTSKLRQEFHDIKLLMHMGHLKLLIAWIVKRNIIFSFWWMSCHLILNTYQHVLFVMELLSLT